MAHHAHDAVPWNAALYLTLVGELRITWRSCRTLLLRVGQRLSNHTQHTYRRTLVINEEENCLSLPSEEEKINSIMRC